MKCIWKSKEELQLMRKELQERLAKEVMHKYDTEFSEELGYEMKEEIKKNFCYMI